MLTVTEVLPMRSTRAWKLSRSPIETGCLKTNWLTATVAIRPLAILAGRTAPAMSTWAMIQPPKMSPLPLASAGIGIVRIARWRSSGSCSGAMPETTARASSSENSGILLSPRSGNSRFFHQYTAHPAADATRRPLDAAALRHGDPARRTGAEIRLANDRQAAALRLGLALARARRARLPGRGQARQHWRAAG